MPRRAQKKRAQRRQRQLENDINTNGIDDHRGGTFKVYDRKAMQTIEKGLNWEQAVKVWKLTRLLRSFSTNNIDGTLMGRFLKDGEFKPKPSTLKKPSECTDRRQNGSAREPM